MNNSEKTLVIKASARAAGFSSKLADELCAGLSGDIKTYNVYDMSFKPCCGCNICEKSGKCRYDDLDSFFKDFEEADLIVFASPVYNSSFPAPLKALIDRFQVYYTGFYQNGKKQMIKKRRKGVLLAASGRDGKYPLSVMENQLISAFSILNIEYCGAVLCSGTDTEPCFKEAKAEVKKLLKGCLYDEKE